MQYPDLLIADSGSAQILPWEQISSRTLIDVPPWMKVHEDTIRLPGGRVIDDYYRIETPDYVIMAVCDDKGRFLLERMYKHGAATIILTSPSGGIDPGEAPLDAARRELLEETGLQAERWTSAGSYLVDGTRGICKAHFFIAQELKQVAQPEQHDIESCATELLTIDEVATAMRDGSICLLPDIALYSLILGPFLSAVQKEN